MIIVTTENIAGKTIKEVLGVVKGQVVQSKHMGSDFMAGLKTMVGGEIKGYTDMLDKARTIATERMIAEAEKLGADAIVGVDIDILNTESNMFIACANGTAVKTEKI